MTIREQLEQLAFAFYSPKPKWITTNDIHEAYVDRFGPISLTVFKRQKFMAKNRLGLFESDHNSVMWRSILVPLIPTLPTSPSINDVMLEMVAKAVQVQIESMCTKDMIKDCLYELCAEQLPEIVKTEFDTRVAPAVKQAVKDKLSALDSLEKDVRETVVNTLSQIISDLTDGEYRCVPVDMIDTFDDDLTE